MQSDCYCREYLSFKTGLYAQAATRSRLCLSGELRDESVLLLHGYYVALSLKKARLAMRQTRLCLKEL